MEASLALFAEVYGRTSFDDAGAPVVGPSTTGSGYDNAFWDGRQLVFGDGDGRSSPGSPSPSTCSVTSSSTPSPSTPPAWTTRASPARSTSRCPTFRLLPQAAAARPDRGEADWLIGEGLFLPVGARPGAAPRWRSPAPPTTTPSSARTPGRLDGRLRRDHPGQRRRPPQLRHPQPRLPPRRGPSAATPGRSPARSGTPPSPRASARTPTSPRSPPRPSPRPRRSRRRPVTRWHEAWRTVGVTPEAGSTQPADDHGRPLDAHRAR